MARTDALDTLEQEILARAFLLDDPDTYRRGVRDALTAVRQAVAGHRDAYPSTHGSAHALPQRPDGSSAVGAAA